MGILHPAGQRRIGGAGAGVVNAVQAQVQATAGVNSLAGVGAGIGGINGSNDGGGVIRDVWAEDLDREMAVLRDLVEKYPYVAMDTEFPGIVARPIGKFPSKADYHYQTLRCNVDMLKIIQLGLTLANDNGELAKVDGIVSTWQFNFRFSLDDDMYAGESIELLKNSGIDFGRHNQSGIDPLKFGELLITSGLVMLPEVKWLSFHSGYDFGYLVKIMSCTPLPKEELEFRKLLNLFFPSLYDIKYLVKSSNKLKGGLQEIADEIGIQRIGPQHQAGSDSLLTGIVFFQVRMRCFEGNIEDEKYLGQIWGLSGTLPAVTNGTSTQTPSTPPPPSETATINANMVTQTPPPSQLTQRNGTPGTPGIQSGYTSAFGKMGM
ncbi:CAF1-domain-containing protein [Ascodesmis nigricans]|uniref:poly(A)-specific ribonuclease n=1 Tax=Ascodesmis nigricans TaxID=341454 RepID=A0A4S2MLI6_9PEZI|nr:CAF1-domain-containing protein [Ascodesmis nigricans]